MINFFIYLGAGFVLYAIVKNNPKLEKFLDRILTIAAIPFNLIKNKVKGVFSKND